MLQHALGLPISNLFATEGHIILCLQSICSYLTVIAELSMEKIAKTEALCLKYVMTVKK